jgi:hypothetical protein
MKPQSIASAPRKLTRLPRKPGTLRLGSCSRKLPANGVRWPNKRSRLVEWLFAPLNHPRALPQLYQIVGIHADRCPIGAASKQIDGAGEHLVMVVVVGPHDLEQSSSLIACGPAADQQATARMRRNRRLISASCDERPFPY